MNMQPGQMHGQIRPLSGPGLHPMPLTGGAQDVTTLLWQKVEALEKRVAELEQRLSPQEPVEQPNT
jgi:uncharacterized protein YceH (UPF0502 family)